MAGARPAPDWPAENHVTAGTQSCRVHTRRSTPTTVWIPEIFAEAGAELHDLQLLKMVEKSSDHRNQTAAKIPTVDLFNT